MTWLESFAIDGVTLPAWRNIAGLAGSPPPRQDLRDRAQRHGSIDRTSFYQARIIEVDDAVLKGDLATLWAAFDTIKGALALGTNHLLTFRRAGLSVDEQVAVRVAAEVKGNLAYDSPGVILWGVAFTAADPRLYSSVETTARYSPTTAEGGVEFALDFPLVFSGGSGTSVMTVSNEGNFLTPPKFTVDGPADAGFSIVNESTGEKITTQGVALEEGDSIVIDVDSRDVTIGGTSRPDFIDAAQTTWFELGPGNTLLRLHGSGFSEDVTALTVAFRDARI